jgi:hypothetical protein
MPPKMVTATPEAHSRRLDWASYLPFLGWMRHYRRQDLAGDLIAGLAEGESADEFPNNPSLP